MLFYTIISLFIFWVFRLYHSLWQYASIAEVYRIAEACITVEVVHFLSNKMVGNMLPRSCYFNAAIYLIIAICASRFMYRMIRTVLNKYRNIKTSNNVMIIGAGEATNVIMREIQSSSYLANSNIACIIDDDRRKVGKYIRGVKVIGTRDKIKEAAKLYDIDEIIFAIPSASNEVKRDILNICKETDCTLKILPGVYQMVDGEINVNSIRNVDVLDLLGRDPIEVDIESIMGYVKDKVIMVTGGGGSIGSELCRQLVSHKPKQLIIFDIYENNAYDIQQELKINYPDANVVTLIGSIRNVSRLESVFAQYKPDIVYHAAAHKHVPLMEVSPDEAVKNNVVGTWNVARMADKYGVKKFVMISTDKAVNPTNVMGATKRICEMIVQTYNEISKTDFVAVRFGNVLGSNGSVIPLFKRQIEAGGPVTVTDPNIIRYFMTIPEAVSLVLQAGTYAWGGEIFVLDMGAPVKIDTLARNLIRLSGYKPDVDIKIVYSGLRPGEKLFEEKLMAEEGMMKTDNELIHIGKPIPFDTETFLGQLGELARASYNNDENIVEMVEKIVRECKEILVLEEGYPVVEEQLKGFLGIGIQVHGRLDGTLQRDGELTPDAVGKALGKRIESYYATPEVVEQRPPALCQGCGHRDMYEALNEVLAGYKGAKVFGDIGCYTLGALPPFRAIDTCIDMGASITMAKGASDAGVYPAVSVIGDSTFTHSGMTGLLDCVNENTNITIVISDNETTAMTGGQDSAGTGRIESICAGIGVDPAHIRVVVPLPKNREEMKAMFREEIAYDGVSVVIPRRECIQTAKRHNAAKQKQ